MEEELLPPPPKKQATNSSVDELLPPPPAKKNETPQQDSTVSSTLGITLPDLSQPAKQESKPSTQSGAEFGWSNREPRQEVIVSTETTMQPTVALTPSVEAYDIATTNAAKSSKKLSLAEKDVRDADTELEQLNAYNAIKSQYPQLFPFGNTLNIDQISQIDERTGKYVPKDAFAVVDGNLTSKYSQKELGEFDQLVKKLRSRAIEFTDKPPEYIQSVAESVANKKLQAQAKLAEADNDFNTNLAALKELNGLSLKKYGVTDAFIDGMAGTSAAIGAAKNAAIMDDEQLSDELEKVYIAQATSNKPEGLKYTAAEMAGGQVVPLLTTVGTGLATGKVGGAAASAATYGTVGYGQNLMQGYVQARAEGHLPLDAVQIARDFATAGAITGGVEGAIGYINPFMKSGGSLTNKTLLTGVKAALKDAGIDATVAMSMQYANNKYGQQLGLDIKDTDGILQQGAGELGFSLAINALFGGAAKLKPQVHKMLTYGLAQSDLGSIKMAVDQAVKEGVIDAARAATTMDELIETKQAFDVIPKELPTKQREDAVPLVKRKQALLREKERGEFPAETIDAQIEKIDAEINEEIGAPLTAKESKEYDTLKQKSKDPEKSLMPSEKARLKHFEKRIEKSKQIKDAERNETKALSEAEGVLKSESVEPTTQPEEATVAKPEAEVVDEFENWRRGEMDSIEGEIEYETGYQAEKHRKSSLLEKIVREMSGVGTSYLKSLRHELEQLKNNPQEYLDDNLKRLKKWKAQDRNNEWDNAIAKFEKLKEQLQNRSAVSETAAPEAVVEKTEEVVPLENEQPATTSEIEGAESGISEGVAETPVVSETKGAVNAPVEEVAAAPVADDVVKGKKKAILNRAVEGEAPENVKDAIDKYGRLYDPESHDEAQLLADNLIKEIGIDAALQAVRNADIGGAPATMIYGRAIDAVGKKIDEAGEGVDVAPLIAEEAALMNEYDKWARLAGQQTSAHKHVQQTFDFAYKLSNQIEKYKEANKGEISPEVETKFRALDKELKEVKKKLAEAEKKATEQAEQTAIKDIQESIAREKKIAKPKIYGKTRIAKGLDDLASALGAKLSAQGTEATKATEALADIGRGLIEEGWATLENVAQKIREHIQEAWGDKVKIDDLNFDPVVDKLRKEAEEAAKIRIPDKMIRDFVERGITDFNELVLAVKDAVRNKYPDATEREIRDAISGYGKIANMSKDEISIKVRKMKDILRITSALEDIEAKKRPLKSGQQRDKLDAEQRAKHKELREAMKELLLDADQALEQQKTALDAAKQRVSNQIEDLQREIDTKEKVPQSARAFEADAELNELKAKRDALKTEHDQIFKDEAFVEQKRLEQAKVRTKKAMADLTEKLRTGDYSKKSTKPVVADTELTKLKVEKLRLQEAFDNERYKAELANRTKWEKAKDYLVEAWGLPRALLATGEFSFMLVQGGIQAIAHPLQAAKAMKTALSHFASEKRSENFMRNLKSQEWYDTMKASKLALTEPNAKLSAREELFYSGWINHIWDGLSSLAGENVGGKIKAANPFKAFERAASGYLDTIRVARFLDGMQMLEKQGKTFQNSPQDYKDVADMINTLTGRASIGAFGEGRMGNVMNRVFFSPRNWASVVKTATPYGLYHFGKMTPTARKMAIADFGKYVGLTTGLVAMAASALNNDDDPETSVELDPRSSDFGKIKLGERRVDPWGGRMPMIVLQARLIMDAAKKTGATETAAFKSLGLKNDGAYKTTTSGDIFNLGEQNKASTAQQLLIRQAVNKLNPVMGIMNRYFESHIKETKAAGEQLVDAYGMPYGVEEELQNEAGTIYMQTLKDMGKDGYDTIDALLAFYAFFGGGVQQYMSAEERQAIKDAATEEAKQKNNPSEFRPTSPVRLQ